MIERKRYLDKLISKKQNGLIKVITGIRRCGKSYLLFNIYKNYLISSGVDEKNIIVGDDCYFGLGVKIIGSVRIGNNVTVGANAVITKDIPDNAIVGGVPAKIIKMKK